MQSQQQQQQRSLAGSNTHPPARRPPPLSSAGSGKTHLVRALAAEARLAIVVLNGGECVGEEADKKLRSAFNQGGWTAPACCKSCGKAAGPALAPPSRTTLCTAL